MEVILKEDVAKLGSRGDVVRVAEGYGRNFLLPRKLTAGRKVIRVRVKSASTSLPLFPQRTTHLRPVLRLLN